MVLKNFKAVTGDVDVKESIKKKKLKLEGNQIRGTIKAVPEQEKDKYT